MQNHRAVVQNAESYKIEQDRDDGARGSNFLHHLSSKSITLHKTPVLGGFRDKEKRLVDYERGRPKSTPSLVGATGQRSQ